MQSGPTAFGRPSRQLAVLLATKFFKFKSIKPEQKSLSELVQLDTVFAATNQP